MTATGKHPIDAPAALLCHRLVDLWTELGALGATVNHRPIGRLTAPELGALVAAETERVRVLTAPEAAPILARHQEAA